MGRFLRKGGSESAVLISNSDSLPYSTDMERQEGRERGRERQRKGVRDTDRQR